MAFICPNCNREFDSKGSLARHKNWHNKEYRENMTGENNPRGMLNKHHSNKTRRIIGEASEKRWSNKEYREKMKKIQKEVWNRPGHRKNYNQSPMWWGKPGVENPMFGKFGKEAPNYKENAGSGAKHQWIRKHYSQKDICNNKCEICGKFRLDLELARFIHIDVRNMDNPMIDYLYLCPKTRKGENCKNNCHTIYDRLTKEQKQELLKGALTREEKLKRVREYMLKNIN